MNQLTSIILDRWATWMRVPVETNLWALNADTECLGYYDGHLMYFWYALNHEWYKMNDKKYAYTGCKEKYEEPLDFEWL